MELMKQIEKEVKNGQVTEYNETEALLRELEETYGKEVPNCSTKDGYNRSKEIASKMTKLRTGLESKRKEFKSPVLALGKMIDSEAKSITTRITAIESPHKEAYRAVDEEKKRIKLEIEDRILEIKNAPAAALELETSEQIETMINDFAEWDISEERFGKRAEEASTWLASSLEKLSTIHAQKIEAEQEALKIEAERAELEALRREKAEAEEAQRLAAEKAAREAEDARIAAEAAEQARIDEAKRQKAEQERVEREKQQAVEREEQAKREAELSEQRRIEQEKQAELDRIAAQEQAKRDAEAAAEQARLAEIKRQEEEQERQRIEQEKREANKRHVGKICKQSKEDLMQIGLDEETAKAVVSAIAKNQVRNININY